MRRDAWIDALCPQQARHSNACNTRYARELLRKRLDERHRVGSECGDLDGDLAESLVGRASDAPYLPKDGPL